MTDDITERFKTAYDHLAQADRLLDDLTTDIETAVDEAIEQISPEVEYDLDTGTMQAHISLDEVTSRINRRLDQPFYASIEGNTLQINDIRDEFDHADVPSLKLDGSQHSLAKEVIETLASTHDNGAPTRKVSVYLEQAGVPSPEHTLNQLRMQGDVYEPRSGYLRTV